MGHNFHTNFFFVSIKGGNKVNIPRFLLFHKQKGADSYQLKQRLDKDIYDQVNLIPNESGFI